MKLFHIYFIFYKHHSLTNYTLITIIYPDIDSLELTLNFKYILVLINFYI